MSKKRPSDIAPEVPEMQEVPDTPEIPDIGRQRYPGPDTATQIDDRTDAGNTIIDRDEVDKGGVEEPGPDAVDPPAPRR